MQFYGSLREAIKSNERDFSNAPIKKWADARSKTIAGKRAAANAYYLNTKNPLACTDPMGDVARRVRRRDIS